MKNSLLQILGIVTIYVFSLWSSCMVSQEPIVETSNMGFLKDATYKEIHDLIRSSYRDTITTLKYIEYYKRKAQSENNHLQLVKAITWKSYYVQDSTEKIALLDEAIAMGNKLESGTYPAITLSYKGSYLYNQGQYQRALECYLEALKISEIRENNYYIYASKHNIATIKGAIGDYENALSIFRECLEYERGIDKNSPGYIESLLKVSEYYIKNQKLDSAQPYIDEGFTKSTVILPSAHNKFLLLKAISAYISNDFERAKESFLKGLNELSDNNLNSAETEIIYNYYLGRLYHLEGEDQTSKHYLMRMDTLIGTSHLTPFEVRDGYKVLIELSDEQKDLNAQLRYTNRLLAFDSLNNSKGILLSKLISNRFETPELIKEKNILIEELQQGKTVTNNLLYITLVIILSLIFIVILQVKKRKRLQEKFESVVSQNYEEDQFSSTEMDVITDSSKKSQLPEGIIEEISNGLIAFEQKMGFLDNKMSSSKLAKKLGTNTKYLSVVINSVKGKSFSNYIKDLRIGHAIREIRTNDHLRKNYSIEGIAKEMGFNNAESFSLAFKRKTGLNPSYYINKINDRSLNS